MLNSTLHGKALTSDKKLKIQQTSPLSMADWTRITYWVDFGDASGVLFENKQTATVLSMEGKSCFNKSNIMYSIK